MGFEVAPAEVEKRAGLENLWTGGSSHFEWRQSLPPPEDRTSMANTMTKDPQTRQMSMDDGATDAAFALAFHVGAAPAIREPPALVHRQDHQHPHPTHDHQQQPQSTTSTVKSRMGAPPKVYPGT